MDSARKVTLHPSWLAHLAEEFEKPSMVKLREFLVEEKKKHLVYPPGKEIFNALDSTPFDQVKVVILGQDPYHGPGQAHGLCFSVRRGTPVPPSLVNIFKELQTDIGIPTPTHGELTFWAEQGVLLLNTSLTVRAHAPQSHSGKGWEEFTDRVIEVLNQKREHLVFLLWGSPAQRKAERVDPRRHCILKAPHPSPLSAYRGFFGCRHFSKTNEYLASQGIAPIDWRLPD
ncbi:MAG: uracil-DNA glycosylase [Spirochaetia bacterium]|nr:uracil-DNA glycosylase [Spirochaetia bacterium]